MLSQELHHLQCVLHVALHPQTQRLHALQQDKRVERRDGGTGVAKDDGTDAGHERSRSGHVGEHGAVIARVGLCKGGELVGIAFPVERAAVHNHAAERSAVATQEFRG